MLVFFNDKDDRILHPRRVLHLYQFSRTSRNLSRGSPILESEVGSEMEAFLFNSILPTLFFVDPWGYKGLSLHAFNAVLKNWGCDCSLLTFNYNRINMGLNNPTRSGTDGNRAFRCQVGRKLCASGRLEQVANFRQILRKLHPRGLPAITSLGAKEGLVCHRSASRNDTGTRTRGPSDFPIRIRTFLAIAHEGNYGGTERSLHEARGLRSFQVAEPTQRFLLLRVEKGR